MFVGMRESRHREKKRLIDNNGVTNQRACLKVVGSLQTAPGSPVMSGDYTAITVKSDTPGNFMLSPPSQASVVMVVSFLSFFLFFVKEVIDPVKKSD